MNAHDVNMMTLGAGASDALILATWWLMSRSDRRKARRALAKAEAAVDRVKQLAEERP